MFISHPPIFAFSVRNLSPNFAFRIRNLFAFFQFKHTNVFKNLQNHFSHSLTLAILTLALVLFDQVFMTFRLTLTLDYLIVNFLFLSFWKGCIALTP